ncbi:hypothetical protein HDU96_001302 [Phlyctochytrium bullatum]|nr:hypothetical protein HDU96_001302 [Phlyctochytrium bullatum]
MDHISSDWSFTSDEDSQKSYYRRGLRYGSNVVTGSADGRVKTICVSMPQEPYEIKSLFGKATTIHESVEPVQCVRCSKDTLAVGCRLEIFFYERMDAGIWTASQKLSLLHPLEGFDLSPGALVVQTTTEFLSYSWSPAESPGPDSLRNTHRSKLWRTELPLSGQAVLLGVSVPVLPLQMCAVAEASWRDALGLSLVYIPERRAVHFNLFRLGGSESGESWLKVGGLKFQGADGANMEITCVASNRHGLIAWGNANGDVVVMSLLDPSDLMML